MAYETIDIGAGAIDRASANSSTGTTKVDYNNPANATGILDSFEVWANTSQTAVVIGTFSGSGTDWDDRDYETIGNVTGGSKQTFTGKNCDVTIGDCIGVYDETGYWERDSSGYSGFGFRGGSYFGQGVQTYQNTTNAGRALSLYATGYNGVPDAPTSVSATDNLTDKVTITWTAGTGETSGHKVYRDGSVLNSDTAISHGTNTFDDTTGTVGTTYAYTVKAINAAGLSAASSVDNGTRVSAFIPQILIF